MLQRVMIPLIIFCFATEFSIAETDWCLEYLQGNATADQAILACSDDITSGKYSGKDLALRYESRGSAYWDKGDYEKAIADFSKLIEIAPELPKPYFLRGSTHWVNGNDDKAIADLSKVIELEPNYADAYYYRGEIYKGRGEMERAHEDYRKAGELDPAYMRMRGGQ